jgi:hypothetical protein
MKMPILLCALVLTGCATRRPSETVDAVAEQKQRAREAILKERDQQNQGLRLQARRLYVTDNPQMSPKTRKAILNEEIKVGMNVWDVVAAYSLWEYTTDPAVAKYKAVGAPPLWTVLNKSESRTAQAVQEHWVLKRLENIRYMHFENGSLKTWED